ncbi:MAG: pseudouridine-5'-phosphate glycosidase [Bacteroidia bacterium]
MQLQFSPTVKAALETGKPVVALESTILAHGMPYPQNLETAKAVERTILEAGAIPATIAIIKGVPQIGLTEEQLNYIAHSQNVIKVSRRDLPVIMAQALDGATTVASTMILAERAGIKVFVTGGIGGVHRKASETFDISADLMELARTSVAVVCAGVKSILDIGLTLEYLETQGVPVLGYQTQDFPAFYTRKSGFSCDYRCDSAEVIAKILKIKWEMGLQGGLIVANPIPLEYAMPAEEINQAIETALQEADNQGIKGKAITPFLLKKIKEITEGRSLAANIQLVLNNAKVGAEIAKAYHFA